MDWINLLANGFCFILLLVVLGRLEAIRIQLKRNEYRLENLNRSTESDIIKRRGRPV